MVVHNRGTCWIGELHNWRYCCMYLLTGKHDGAQVLIANCTVAQQHNMLKADILQLVTDIVLSDTKLGTDHLSKIQAMAGCTKTNYDEVSTGANSKDVAFITLYSH